jgi:hypothetical protein
MMHLRISEESPVLPPRAPRRLDVSSGSRLRAQLLPYPVPPHPALHHHRRLVLLQQALCQGSPPAALHHHRCSSRAAVAGPCSSPPDECLADGDLVQHLHHNTYQYPEPTRWPATSSNNGIKHMPRSDSNTYLREVLALPVTPPVRLYQSGASVLLLQLLARCMAAPRSLHGGRGSPLRPQLLRGRVAPAATDGVTCADCFRHTPTVASRAKATGRSWSQHMTGCPSYDTSRQPG